MALVRLTPMSRYSELDEVRLRILKQNLEARLVLCEMRRASLNFEIDSPQIIPVRRVEALAERDQVLVEWGVVMTMLEELKAVL